MRTLRDFTRLLITFFCTLVVLAAYQQIRLYTLGVLDQIVGKSLLLLIVHHVGFAALIALPLSFLFNAIERKKPTNGFKTVRLILLVLLLIEGLLIEYYVTNFEILGAGFLSIYTTRISMGKFLWTLAILTPICIGVFYTIYHITSSTYRIIGRMYPFTIILFSLFLATLYSDKKPVNENKTQHLVAHAVSEVLDLNKYKGEEEYPMLKAYHSNNDLAAFFELREQPPNLVFIVMDGIGSDFVGKDAIYRGFTPYLDSLAATSLYWPYHLSNTGEAHASLATILGSLPFGESGFNKAPHSINRNTLLGVLKKNGYMTSFNYGGNSALYQWDKFLFEDRIDNLLDFKGFSTDYTMQEEDAAGISLGYPDGELYRKWFEDRLEPRMPFAEIFFTLSSKAPFQIPDKKEYVRQVEEIRAVGERGQGASKIIRKNKEVFASLLYTDQALEEFISRYKNQPSYSNTIFIITGSHNLAELPPRNALTRYRVPLIIHSPLLKQAKEIKSLVSHADITPALIGLLDAKYQIEVPAEMSFMGSSLLNLSQIDTTKRIPLYHHAYNIKDFISGSYLLSGGYLHKINSNLTLSEPSDEASSTKIEKEFRQFRAINKYVIRENKLMPEQNLLFAQVAREPDKQEMIWINSVFSGADFDNAYKTARSLALNGDHERALLLCSYILNQVPGHADTEILMGRIHAWSGNYERAEEILKGAILKYPVYADAYSALLDVYFWSDKNDRALLLSRQIDRNKVENEELKIKIDRASKRIQDKQKEKNTISEVQGSRMDRSASISELE